MLKNKISAIQIHQIVRFASTILVGIVLIKMGFSTDTIGLLEGILFVGATFTTFVVNGWIQTTLSYFHTTTTTDKKAFFLHSYIFLSLFSTLIMSILYFFSQPISFFLCQKNLYFLPVFGVYLWLYTPTYLLEYFYLLEEKNQSILWCSIATLCSMVLSAFWVGYRQGSIEDLLFCWIGIAFLRHCLLLYFLHQKSTFYAWDNIAFGDLAKKALPFLGIAFLGQYATNFDAWLLNFHYKGDATAFAIFRYGARELPIFLALATGLSNDFSVRFAKEKEAILPDLLAKSKFLMHLCFGLSILLLLSSQHWFTLLFSKAFEDSIIIFDIYLLLIISRLLFPQAILTGLQASRLMLKITVAELIFNIVASLILVQFWGMKGIAAGTFLAFLFEKILLAFFLKKYFNIAFERYTPLTLWLFYSVVLLVIFAFK